MFDVGLQELVVILVVFGPNRLPELARAFARGLGEFRRASEEVRASVGSPLTLNGPAPAASSPVSLTAETPAPPMVPVAPTPESAQIPTFDGSETRAEPYMTKSGSRLFHARGCGWTLCISEPERVYYKPAAEARWQGLQPCPVCEPRDRE